MPEAKTREGRLSVPFFIRCPFPNRAKRQKAKPRKPQKTSVNTYDTYDTYDTSKNNATETLPKRQNGSKCSVVTASVVTDFSSEPTASDVASPELSDNELLARVLNELPQGAIFTRGDILLAVQKHAPNRVREIGTQVREHILRLGTSDRYIHRDDAKRPNGYRGLIDQNGDGVICPDPLPPNFE